MREEFFRVYTELTRAYSRVPASRWYPGQPPNLVGPQPDRALTIVQRAVNQVVDELGLHNRMRPDAHHFLVVNLHQMVTLPILVEASNPASARTPGDGSGYVRGHLANDVEHDVRVILEAAAAASPEFPMTGRSILDAVSRVYDRLKTAASNAWG